MAALPPPPPPVGRSSTVRQRFGRARRYALGKLSGKASVDHNLKALGIELTAANRDLVLQKVIELGDRKHTVSREDLPYIIADVLKSPAEQLVRIDSYVVHVGTGQAPHAEVEIHYQGQVERASAGGDGGYDALMQALRKAVKPLGIELPRLADYRVRIPPGGKTGALVETLISWTPAKTRSGGSPETFTTIGVDSDQMAAAVIATEKMLNAVITQAARPGRAGKSSRKSSRKASRKSSQQASRKPSRTSARAGSRPKRSPTSNR